MDIAAPARQDSTVTAVVLAGGRFCGRDAEVAGTTIKALASVGDETMLRRVLRALQDAERVRQVIVVGPEEVRSVAANVGVSWRMETGSLLGNAQAGATAAGVPEGERILLIGSDLAAPEPHGLDDFLVRAPGNAALAVPLVSRADYEAAYPGSPSTFVPLSGGEFTMGSQFLLRTGLLLDPPPAAAALLGHRKSQLRMALCLGPAALWGLLARSLAVERLERRSADLLGAPVAAVRDCRPSLAFDVDDARDFTYARQWHENKK